MNCPTCGGPMHLAEGQEYLVCDFCTSTYFPEPNPDGVRVLGEPASSSCPICAIPLTHAAVAGERILYCQRCHGILIGMGIIETVIEDLRARRDSPSGVPHPPDLKALDRHIACPQCGQQMDTHLYGGPGNVVIDTCESCSVLWLDPSELMRIVRGLDKHYEE